MREGCIIKQSNTPQNKYIQYITNQIYLIYNKPNIFNIYEKQLYYIYIRKTNILLLNTNN